MLNLKIKYYLPFLSCCLISFCCDLQASERATDVTWTIQEIVVYGIPQPVDHLIIDFPDVGHPVKEYIDGNQETRKIPLSYPLVYSSTDKKYYNGFSGEQIRSSMMTCTGFDSKGVSVCENIQNPFDLFFKNNPDSGDYMVSLSLSSSGDLYEVELDFEKLPDSD